MRMNVNGVYSERESINLNVSETQQRVRPNISTYLIYMHIYLIVFSTLHHILVHAWDGCHMMRTKYKY